MASSEPVGGFSVLGELFEVLLEFGELGFCSIQFLL